MSLETQIKNSINTLKELEEDELVIEIGRRLELNMRELKSEETLTSANPVQPISDSSELMGPFDALYDLAVDFLNRVHYQLYSVICDSTDPDNKKIMVYVDRGVEVLASVLAMHLATTLGMLPGIAATVSTLIAKRLLRSGHDVLCERWREEFTNQ